MFERVTNIPLFSESSYRYYLIAYSIIPRKFSAVREWQLRFISNLTTLMILALISRSVYRTLSFIYDGVFRQN